LNHFYVKFLVEEESVHTAIIPLFCILQFCYMKYNINHTVKRLIDN
jgi:hypothetical protein